MQYLKSGKCRRRKFQTLALIVVIVILYFLLQFFSLSRLGHFQIGKKQYVSKDYVKVDLDPNVEKAPERVDANSKEEEEEEEIEKLGPVKNVAVPRGVHLSSAYQYAENSANVFKCFASEVQIPMSQVNDDFCDCPDSSDEPGTSACPNGRFYCKVQLPQRDPQFVHSSKVNDGICDCCDGSDEWEARPVPAIMNLEGKRGAVFHTPCNDRCGDVQKLLENEKRIRRQGLVLQKRYLTAALTELSVSQHQKYGPEGVFYLLSKQCYNHKAGGYVYTVCPFESVTQSRGAGLGMVLGRQGRWMQQVTAGHVLQMGQGDAALCPDGQPRQTLIHFLCGLEDRVIDIDEDEKCRYSVKFSTPAAC